MSDIFISYASQDRSQVKILAEALGMQGWSIWWDRTIPFGKPFDVVIEEQLAAAKCVLVVWSQHSVTSDWVLEEAHEGLKRGILIPVFIEKVTPPFGYRRIQGAELDGWKPGEQFPIFDKLLEDIASVLGSAPVEAELHKQEPSEKAQDAAAAASKAEAILKPPEEKSTLPPIQNISGWAAEKVKSLQQQTAAALGISVEFRDRLGDGSMGPEMVVIPAGEFLMGSPEDEEGHNDNERLHEVRIERPFAIGKYAVTFEEYDRFVETTGRVMYLFPRVNKPNDQGWGRGRRPVINVSWYDAVAYIEWLSEQTGQSYRLPTEAAWEYAARAGTTTPFHFGATITTYQANYDGNYTYAGGHKGVYRQRTVEVGKFLPNTWGLYEVHGNVWEWTCSAYAEHYGGAELECISKKHTDPRVLRGGSWNGTPRGVRAATRFRFTPDTRSYIIGFRLVRQF